MTPEQIQAMAKGLAEGQAVWYVLSACIGGAIAGLGAYFAEKGKNRATKEDIAAITTKVKEVEDVFNRGLADLNAHHQLRMVAAEKRLQAHQEAFGLWMGLMDNFHRGGEFLIVAIERCNDWYLANCIYLGSSSRDVFRQAIGDACTCSNPVLLAMDRDPKERIFLRLSAVGNILLKEVDLPGFTELQQKDLIQASATSGKEPAPA